MDWINNAAAGGFDAVDASPAFMTNALYGEDKLDDEFQEEDTADLPPGPIEMQAEYGMDAIVETNFASRLLDDQDSHDEPYVRSNIPSPSP